jgi:hypothetical protein
MRTVTLALSAMVFVARMACGGGEAACRAALNTAPAKLHPTAEEHQAEIAAARNAFVLCRPISVPPDLRAVSAQRWAIFLKRMDWNAAEAIYRNTIREIEAGYGPDDPALLPVLTGLMDMLLQRSESKPTEESFRLANEIVRINEQAFGRRSEQTARALLILGRLHDLNGNRATAELVYRDAIASAVPCGPKCSTLALTYVQLRNLIKTDPGRRREVEELDHLAMTSLPDRPKRTQ